MQTVNDIVLTKIIAHDGKETDTVGCIKCLAVNRYY